MWKEKKAYLFSSTHYPRDPKEDENVMDRQRFIIRLGYVVDSSLTTFFSFCQSGEITVENEENMTPQPTSPSAM